MKRLLVGRRATTEVYANEFTITDVQIKGREVHIYGRANPKRRRSILLATHLSGIKLTEQSSGDAQSKGECKQ